jgi:hypothetical protein
VKLGLAELGSLSATKLTPLIRYIAGTVCFRRVYGPSGTVPLRLDIGFRFTPDE